MRMDTCGTRAFATVQETDPYECRLWLAGEWGFESDSRLRALLARVPRISRYVDLDCRRITVIDGTTMTTMMHFAESSARRGVPVTFACDNDPVERLIALCRIDRLVIDHRPRSRTAGSPNR